MNIDDHIEFSLSQIDTLILQRITEVPRPGSQTTPRTPKKTRLVRLPLRETPSAKTRAVRKERVERIPAHIERTRTYTQRQRKTPDLCGSSQLNNSELVTLTQANPPLYLMHTLQHPSLKSAQSSNSKLNKQRVMNKISFKNGYKRVITDPLFKNSIFNMASTLILGGLGFVFWIIIARLYKAENVGIATTLISIMTLLSSFTLLGLNVSLNRYLPKSTNKNALINSSFVIVTMVTVLASAIFLLGLNIFSPRLLFLRSNLFYIISFSVFIIFCSWNSLVESIFMAFRNASGILIKNIIISMLKLVLPLALIAFGAYGIFSSTASALALGVLAGLIILVLKFKIRPSISINVSLIRETSVYSFANYIASFMFNMPSLLLPVIILNALSPNYAAYYYIASMIQNLLLIIPLATTQALLTEGSYNEAELKKHVWKALATIFIILIPATAAIVFWGNILLQFFGKTYTIEAFQFLQLYSVSTIFTTLILIANAIMRVKHQIKSLVLSNVVASVLTLWLSYAFISNKLVGIGWGLTLGQAIVGLASMFFIIKVFSNITYQSHGQIFIAPIQDVPEELRPDTGLAVFGFRHVPLRRIRLVKL